MIKIIFKIIFLPDMSENTLQFMYWIFENVHYNKVFKKKSILPIMSMFAIELIELLLTWFTEFLDNIVCIFLSAISDSKKLRSLIVDFIFLLNILKML